MNALQALVLAKAYTEATIKGEGAIKGKDGLDGKSAYQIAVAHGFEGTEEEWLESLKVHSDVTVYVSSKPQKELYDIRVAIEDTIEQVLAIPNLRDGALISLIQPFNDGATELVGSGYIINHTDDIWSGAFTFSVPTPITSINMIGAYDFQYIISTGQLALEKKLHSYDMKNYAVALQQELANKGKSLVIGEDGRVIPKEIKSGAEIDDTSTTATDKTYSVKKILDSIKAIFTSGTIKKFNMYDDVDITSDGNGLHIQYSDTEMTLNGNDIIIHNIAGGESRVTLSDGRLFLEGSPYWSKNATIEMGANGEDGESFINMTTDSFKLNGKTISGGGSGSRTKELLAIIRLASSSQSQGSAYVDDDVWDTYDELQFIFTSFPTGGGSGFIMINGKLSLDTEDIPLMHNTNAYVPFGGAYENCYGAVYPPSYDKTDNQTELRASFFGTKPGNFSDLAVYVYGIKY